ncbi:MAG: ABC transporter ATP-binding protein, partial [Clostridia bacterium]|nr:ABC transporter ATP-binding protein [Clostridia bacterium]
MLKLCNIKKDYLAGDNKVEALKGIDIEFRKNEFVSILGQSGCGKTTLLNIIGGLDKYSDGDLIINGKSTKQFRDRDWDAYRNHSIGFVFQSYNLIPHQTVLQNVELALTLSGVSKSERRERAKKALEEVGLGDQLNKKPNEMSGGQMQRVAIARALVNNPDIILADEPTGALDTETSIQVMEILKRISNDRLIIMVTHNPDLAEKYSSRIIRMLDGIITNDSLPITEEEKNNAENTDKLLAEKRQKTKKPSMSFGTSFMLSLKNLFTKKGRTTLTAFAGSIGIIGIALILAISQGMTTYIDEVQESTLSSYPLTIEDTTVELTDLMQTFMNINSEDNEHKNDAVYKKSALYNIINAMNSLEEQENDLKSFKKFLNKKINDENSNLYEAVNGVQYSYNLDMLIYTKNVDGTIIRSHTEEILQELMAKYMSMDMSAMSSMNQMSSSSPFSMRPMSSGLWQELLPGNDGAPINKLLINQYDIVYGSWPNDYNEIVLVVDENNELDDVTLYALGLLPEEKMAELIDAAVNGTKLEIEEMKWSYEDICNSEYKTILNADCYALDEKTGLYNDLRDTESGLRYLYDNGLSLKVTGIIRPAEDSDTKMLSGSICYTNKLTEYLIEKAKGSKVIEAQIKNPDIDILSGLPFKSTTGTLTDKEKETEFKEYIVNLNEEGKADVYIKISSIPSKEFLEQQINNTMGNMTRKDIENTIYQGMSEQVNVSKEKITEYLASMSDEELNEIFSQMLTEQIKAQYAAQVESQLSSMSTVQLLGAFNQALS